MAHRKAKHRAVQELLRQALETEIGLAQLYQAALSCAIEPGVRHEWEFDFRHVLRRQDVLRAVLRSLEIDPLEQSPGRLAAAEIGKSLVNVIELTRRTAPPAAAQIVAADCVLTGQAKGMLNWELIGLAADRLEGDVARVLREAHDEVEADEDRHHDRSVGWAREMWLDWMGFDAVLPPPEALDVGATGAGAPKAERARRKMI